MKEYYEKNKITFGTLHHGVWALTGHDTDRTSSWGGRWCQISTEDSRGGPPAVKAAERIKDVAAVQEFGDRMVPIEDALCALCEVADPVAYHANRKHCLFFVDEKTGLVERSLR